LFLEHAFEHFRETVTSKMAKLGQPFEDARA